MKREKGKAIEQSKTHRNGTWKGQAPGNWVSLLNPGPHLHSLDPPQLRVEATQPIESDLLLHLAITTAGKKKQRAK